MKLRFLAVLLLCTSVRAQYTIPAHTAAFGTAVAGGSWSLIQKTGFNACSAGTSCVVTVSSTGAGHLGVIMGHTNTGTVTITSVTGGGTWLEPAGCHINGGGSIGAESCAYTLSTTASVTSYTVNLSASSVSSFIFYEYSWSGSSFALDTGASGGLGTVSDGTSGTSLAGVGLTLACTKCIIVQGLSTSGGNVTGVSTPYSNFQGTSFAGQADLENSNSGTAPTFTNSNSQTAAGAAIAIAGSGSGGGGVTWTLNQHTNNLTCAPGTIAATHACTMTSTATGSGHGLILLTSIFDQTLTGNAPTVNSSSGDPGLTHCPAAYATIFVGASDANAAVDCYYVTSSTSGETSFTVTWNTPSQTTTNIFIDVELLEVTRSTGTPSLDNTNNTSVTSCNTTCTGASVTVTATDYIADVTAFDNPNISGPGAPFTNPVDLDQSNVTSAFVGALNQTTGTALVFSTTGAAGYFLDGRIALK
jgi:hypothetical protein